MATNGSDLPAPVPFRLKSALAIPAGWPPDVAPGEIIRAAHVNAIRSSVYAWPGDVDGQSHTLSNVHLVNATGVMLDPTTAAGDLIARGAAAIGRLAIGTPGQVLTADNTQPQLMRWAPLPAAPVTSFNSRTGAIIPEANDYRVDQITGAMPNPTIAKGDLIGRSATANDRLPIGTDGQVLTVDSSTPLSVKWAPAAVASFNGRTGAIIPKADDYTAMMVTNAVSMQGTYADPPWITSFPYARLSGLPTAFAPAPHTHDAGAIVSGVLSTARLGTGVANNSVYLRGDGTWAGVAGGGGGGAVISVFGRAGEVIAQAGDYKVAMIDGAVADPTTMPGDLLVRNNLNSIVRLPIGANGQVLQTDLSLSVRMKWTSIEASVQTPWVTNINAAGFNLFSVGRVGVGTAAPNYGVDVVGDINYTGVFRQNGVPVSFGGAQTPWTSDINAGNFSLFNANRIGIQVATTAATLAPLHVAAHTPGGIGQITMQDLDQSASGNPITLISGIGSEGTRCWTIGNSGGTFTKHLLVWNDRSADLIFATNSTERARLLANGNMGVATNNAQVPLHVAGAEDLFRLDGTSANGPYMRFVSGASQKWAIGHSLGHGPLNSFVFYSNLTNTSILTLLGTGNIGIGVNNPSFHTQIYGPGQATYLYNPGTTTGGALLVQDSNGGAGNGGVVCFGANQGPFACIKGYLVNATGPQGNLYFCTRINPSDGRLFPGLAIDSAGNVYTYYNTMMGDPPGGVRLDIQSLENSDTTGALRIWALNKTVAANYSFYGISGPDRYGIQTNGGGSNTVSLQPSSGHVAIGTTASNDALTVYSGVSSAGGQIRFANTQYGAFWYNDNINAYLLFTNSGDPLGGFNSLRPFYISFASGNVVMNEGVKCGANGVISQAGDFAVSRNSAPNTGVIYFGNTLSKYLYYDGSAWQMPGGPLNVSNGYVNATAYWLNGAPWTPAGGVYIQNNAQAAVGPITTLNFAPTGSISWILTQNASTMTIASQYVSDARLKTNVRDLIGGMPLIERLRPREFEFNGLANTAAGRRGVSLIAQDLQEISPASVETFRSKLNPDDAEETDLLHFNPTEIVMHLILAVQQLAARLTILEASKN